MVRRLEKVRDDGAVLGGGGGIGNHAEDDKVPEEVEKKRDHVADDDDGAEKVAGFLQMKGEARDEVVIAEANKEDWKGRERERPVGVGEIFRFYMGQADDHESDVGEEETDHKEAIDPIDTVEPSVDGGADEEGAESHGERFGEETEDLGAGIEVGDENGVEKREKENANSDFPPFA